jgi:isopentenyl phosphate kinase
MNKVQEALVIARALPDLEVRIFSGEEPGVLQSVLLGSTPGTLIRAEL